MEKSKLFGLYGKLNRRERRRFRAFVHSPYYNKNELVIRLLDVTEGFLEGRPVGDGSVEAAMKEVLPPARQCKKQFAYLQSELLQLLERFLGLEYYQQKAHQAEIDILSALLEKNATKHLDSRYRRTRHSLQQEHQDSMGKYESRYALSRLATMKDISRRLRTRGSHLQQASDDLDSFYFASKLQYGCEMLNRERILNMTYDTTTTALIAEYLEQMEDLPLLIKLYLHIYKTYKAPEDESVYEELIRLIYLHQGDIHKDEMRTILLYAINHGQRKVRHADKGTYLRRILGLFQIGLSERFLFQGKYLSHWTYSNAALVGLNLREYEWTEDFIVRYRDHLEPATRDDPYHYMLANMYYHKGEYEKVLDLLRALKFVDMQYHMGARVILIKTFYATGALESLLSLLASFSAYLRRNKQISPGLKKTYLNFCNLLHQILKVRPADREKLLMRIRQTEPLAERTWLEKVHQVWNPADEETPA